MIVISAYRRVVHKYPARSVDQDRSNGSEHISAGRDFLDDDEEDGPDSDPEQQKNAECSALPDALALRIGCPQQLSPVPHAEEARGPCAPAEPVQRGKS